MPLVHIPTAISIHDTHHGGGISIEMVLASSIIVSLFNCLVDSLRLDMQSLDESIPGHKLPAGCEESKFLNNMLISKQWND